MAVDVTKSTVGVAEAISDPEGLSQLRENFISSTPFVDFEYVDVTFNTANADTDIRHNLHPDNPEDIDYYLVRSDRSCNVYNDNTGSRKAWGKGYVILRCTTASATVRLLLMVKRAASTSVFRAVVVDPPAAPSPISSSLVPGLVIPYAGSSAPTGWLLCDGSAVSRTTYANLFGVVGTTFGVGDGSTTFNVPDLRQRFPLGKAASGTGSTLGSTGGAINHTHDEGTLAVASHSHTVNPPDTNLSFTAETVDVNLDGSTAGVVRTISVVPHTDIAQFDSGNASPGLTGDTGSANPPFIALNYLISV